MKHFKPLSLAGGIVLALVWIATLALMTCFINTAKDIPPSINTIISVIVGGLVGVLTGKGHQPAPSTQDEEPK